MAEMVLLAAATAVSAAGTIAGGFAQKAGADFQAKQLDMRAKEEVAASQREAFDIRKQKDLALSRGQSVAAASGLGATDESVLETVGDLEQTGEYHAGLARYGGEERAKGVKMQAAASRFEGKQALTGSLWKAGATILGGASNMAGKYGGGGPPSSSASVPMPGTDWSYGQFDLGYG